MKSLHWLSRVPATVEQTPELLKSNQLISQESDISSYRIANVDRYDVHIELLWLIVESYARKLADLKQLEKRLRK